MPSSNCRFCATHQSQTEELVTVWTKRLSLLEKEVARIVTTCIRPACKEMDTLRALQILNDDEGIRKEITKLQKYLFKTRENGRVVLRECVRANACLRYTRSQLGFACTH